MTIPNLQKKQNTVISTIVLAIYNHLYLYDPILSINIIPILLPYLQLLRHPGGPGTHRENGPLREVFPELPPPRAPRKAPGAAKGAPQGVRDEDHALVALRLSGAPGTSPWGPPWGPYGPPMGPWGPGRVSGLTVTMSSDFNNDEITE